MNDDLVSRQAAIDEVEKSRRLNHHRDSKSASAHEFEHRHFLKILMDLPPAEPQWIPCSERLPKKSGKYYVSGGDKAWICEFLIIPNFTGGWCNDASNPVVQAWMPLPKPYKGDKE